jgi:Rrf2 family transcriptional regulator, cysteine metabolism repressor
LKITYKGDYALKAILDLSTHSPNNGVVPLVDISQRQNVPLQYLEQIMLILKGAGYVNSKRGIGGGFFLSRDPADITIGEIIRLIEGPVEPIICGKANHDSSCGEEEQCAFREIWVQVAQSTSQIVDHTSFADIIKRDRELKAKDNSYTFHI